MTALVLCEVEHSPFCLKTHRALRALGLPYTSRIGLMPATFKDLNPLAQVPVLLIDGEPVCDSTRILERALALNPAGLHASDEAWLWEEFADTALNAFLVASRWADPRNWELVKAAYFGKAPAPVRALIVPRIRKRVLNTLIARDVWRAGAQACWQRFEALLDRLDGRAPVEGFWLGAALSVADIAMFAQLHGLRIGLTPWQHEQIDRRARLGAWLDRIDAATRASAEAWPSSPSSSSASAPAPLRSRPSLPIQDPASIRLS